MRQIRRYGFALALVASAGPFARGQDRGAIDKGVAYLSSRAGQARTGEAALIALALNKAGKPGNDPALAAALNRVRRQFNGTSYISEQRGGADVYEAAVCILAMANIDPTGFKNEIAAAARHLVAKQKGNGAWDYDQRNTSETGDTSISQYAVLGLWEAENAGYEVAPRVWDRAAGWYLSVQHSQGSWNYHRDEGKAETISMTAAGVGSLLICDRQLARHRRGNDAGVSSLLKPLESEQKPSAYAPSNSRAKINAAAQKGISWIGSNFRLEGPIVGESVFYGLYGIERLGALARREELKSVNWFEVGRAFLLGTQGGDGSWNAQYGQTVNTAWAVLFLTKSTEQSIRKIDVKRLGAGTLFGGRELPTDLSTFAISAQGRVVIRPMNGAIDAMLDVLGDPRAQEADSALAGLIGRYHAEGPKVLRPHKDRFRKLLEDRDPGVRRAAAWALGRTADLDVVPALIGALRDEDDAVVNEAKVGLQVISRKIVGYGPPEKPTAEQREEAAKRWRAWYDTVRPPDLAGPDADLGASEAPSP